MNKKTLVLGASTKPSRYAYMAALKLKRHSIPTVLVGARQAILEDQEIMDTWPMDMEGIDTVSLYLSEQNQQGFEDKIIQLKPRRVIFNPGTENPSFAKILNEKGIETIEACTLVMLSTGQY